MAPRRRRRRSARRSPAAVARRRRGHGIACRGGRGLRHFVPRRLGAAARLRTGSSARRSCCSSAVVARASPRPGAQLLRAQTGAAQRLARILPGLAIDLGPAQRRAEQRPALRLRVAASHDLALAALVRDAARVRRDRARALRDGQPARIAGIRARVAPTSPASTCRSAARATWRARAVPALAARAPRQAHPLRRSRAGTDPRRAAIRRRCATCVTSPSGICASSIASAAPGTRLLVDRMIADERIEPRRPLDGFGNEEFTHPAVAATVASGGADAGFGLRAAAAEYGLAFVPLVRERYFLAVRAKDAAEAARRPPARCAEEPGLARRVRRLPGYAGDRRSRADVLMPRPARARADARRRARRAAWSALAPPPVSPRPRARPPSAARPPGRSRAPDTAP